MWSLKQDCGVKTSSVRHLGGAAGHQRKMLSYATLVTHLDKYDRQGNEGRGVGVEEAKAQGSGGQCCILWSVSELPSLVRSVTQLFVPVSRSVKRGLTLPQLPRRMTSRYCETRKYWLCKCEASLLTSVTCRTGVWQMRKKLMANTKRSDFCFQSSGLESLDEPSRQGQF